MRLASFAGTNGVVRLGAVTDNGFIDLRTAARNMGVAADAFITFSGAVEMAEGSRSRTYQEAADAPYWV